MNLYCDRCCTNHQFDLFQVERLVYGLQAAFAEVDSIPATDKANDEEGARPLICLQDALGLAQDQEMYGEHVRELVIQRYGHELEDWSIPAIERLVPIAKTGEKKR